MNRPKESDQLFPEVDSEPGVDAVAALTVNGAREFSRALRRVHVGFVAFVLACLAALALCYPRLADGRRVDALADLARLPADAQIAALRLQIAKKSEGEFAFDLERVVRAVALPELTAKQGLGPQAQLQVAEVPALKTLGELASAAKSGARFPVRGPNPEALAASLRWRLARQLETRAFVLTDLRLSHAVSLQAVDAEAVVEPARVESLSALAAYDQAYAHYTVLRDHCDDLAKQGMSKKTMQSAVQERVAAYEALTESKVWMRRAARTYSDRAARALRRGASARKDEGSASLVVATLQADGSKPWRIEIPMARAARSAMAPAFGGSAELTRLQGNPLWSELSDLDALGAKQQIEGQVSFHLRASEIAGVRISGLAVLQVLPLLLLTFVWMLTRSCRAATRAYNPFGSNQGTRLPTPGTGNRALDRTLLLSLPIVVCSLVCVSLWRVHAAPWIAAALSLLLLAQSLRAVRVWKEQHRLLEIARNRSLIQPLPERDLGAVGGSRLTEM